MTHRVFLTSTIAVTSCLWASCGELPRGLDEYCAETPMVARCPTSDCRSGDFPCVAFCIETYPDGSDEAPDMGMGAWCDDDAIPDDYGVFCRERPEVLPCSAWCDEHPGRCHGSDGDADADGEMDASDDADMLECTRDDECDDGIECSVDSCSEAGRCVFDVDLDGDGSECTMDCNDGDERNFPGNRELCDGFDNDCDGDIEGDFNISIETAPIAGVAHPRQVSLAWSGSVYGVSWCDGTSMLAEQRSPQAAIINGEGGALWSGSIPDATSGCHDVSITWNGSSFLVVWLDGGQLNGALLQVSGIFDRPTFSMVEGVSSTRLDVRSYSGGRYGIVTKPETSEHVTFTTLDENFEIASGANELGDYIDSSPALAAGPESFLVATTNFNIITARGGVDTYGFDANGARTRNASIASSSDLFDSATAAAVGDGFVVTWVDMTFEEIHSVSLGPLGTEEHAVYHFVDSDLDLGRTIEARVATASARGGAPGAGLFWIGTDVSSSGWFLQAVRVDRDGYPVGQQVLVGELENEPTAVEIFDASPSEQGLAVIWVDTEGGDDSISFASIETCF